MCGVSIILIVTLDLLTPLQSPSHCHFDNFRHALHIRLTSGDYATDGSDLPEIAFVSKDVHVAITSVFG